MAQKKLKSGLKLDGVAPNILLQHVEVTAPFLFKGELTTTEKNQTYLAKLIHYKKNLNSLKNIDLTEYFYLCMAAHWATAGTFVPTNVDNQIREGLWKHEMVASHLSRMAQITIESWNWDYQQVTNRKSYNEAGGLVLSTHEGTWLSVAIGAYCALNKNKRPDLANDVYAVILAEIDKEEKILSELREKRDAVNFLRTAALMAHNFGDLDRVIDQWQMSESDPVREKIYKLGHRLNPNYSPVLAFSGQVNKEFLSLENHRHMSMRGPKCLRKSYTFLIPVGPFMDTWGEILGSSPLLSLEDKAEIVAALFEGFSRQDRSYGYARALRGLLSVLPEGMKTLESVIPFSLVQDIEASPMHKIMIQAREEFEQTITQKLFNFLCPVTGQKF